MYNQAVLPLPRALSAAPCPGHQRPALLPSCLLAGLLDDAMYDFSHVLRLDPQNVEAAYARGTVHHKLGSLEPAIADFSTCLELDPNHVKAAYSRAACRNALGQFDMAIGALGAQAVRIDPPYARRQQGVLGLPSKAAGNGQGGGRSSKTGANQRLKRRATRIAGQRVGWAKPDCTTSG